MTITEAAEKYPEVKRYAKSWHGSRAADVAILALVGELEKHGTCGECRYWGQTDDSAPDTDSDDVLPCGCGACPCFWEPCAADFGCTLFEPKETP